MIPILMIVFAIGGTTFGMAEESLAFYALIITVMIAAGYDSLVGGVDPPARLRHRRPRLDDQPVRDRASPRGSPACRSRRASSAGSSSSSSGTAIGIVFVMRYAAQVKARPDRRRSCRDQTAENEAQFRTDGRRRRTRPPLTGPPEGRRSPCSSSPSW